MLRQSRIEFTLPCETEKANKTSKLCVGSEPLASSSAEQLGDGAENHNHTATTTYLSICSIFCISSMTKGERNSGLAGEVGERTRGCRALNADLVRSEREIPFAPETSGEYTWSDL